MIDARLLKMLRCPNDGRPLELANQSLVDTVNDAIGRTEIRDRLDQPVTRSIEGGLVTSDAGWLYPIRDGIPSLVADEAIAIGGLS